MELFSFSDVTNWQDTHPVVDETTLNELLDVVLVAQQIYKQFTQEQVDYIFEQCSIAANNERIALAQLAVKEGKMGTMEDKALKNQLASESIHNTYKTTRTCEIIEEDISGGFSLYAEPMGILAAIVPCTNPTSTTIFKALLALKTRNCIIFSPHPRTVQCTIAAAKLIRNAAISAGAPPNCIGWLDTPSVSLCRFLMGHDHIAMIIATGARNLVKAASSSGKPSLGGGSGNTPVIIDETANIPSAIHSILISKTFDNGMICASEQSVIVLKAINTLVKDEFMKSGGYFIETEEDKIALSNFIIKSNGEMNPESVGQPAKQLALLSGINSQQIPPNCKVLLVELDEVGLSEPLSHEKLCPCLGYYVVNTFDDALNKAVEIIKYGGMGHTSVLYTNMDHFHKEDRIQKFQKIMPTGRSLICMPSSQGAIGNIYNFCQIPSLSLGCGSWGGNASAEGLQVKHLLNIKQICQRREHIVLFKLPSTIVFATGATSNLWKQYINTKSFIVTDTVLNHSIDLENLINGMKKNNIQFQLFAEILLEPTDDMIQAGITYMNTFQPDTIIGFGSEFAMDAAKLMRLKYEYTDIDLDTLTSRYLDMSQRLTQFPKQEIKKKIQRLICIPTIGSNGSEMTPIATLKSTLTLRSTPIIDYSLIADIAIIDGDFAVPHSFNIQTMTEKGFLAIANCIESYVSMTASHHTQALSMKAFELLFRYLPLAIQKQDEDAWKQCQIATSISGMAIGNAFIGICYSLASELKAEFDLSIGTATGILLPHIIRFNADLAPTRQGIFAQYDIPKAMIQYGEISDALQRIKNKCNIFLPSDTAEDKTNLLIQELKDMRKLFNLPHNIQACHINESLYLSKVEKMALLAFDNQMVVLNPRYPLISELKDILLDIYDK